MLGLKYMKFILTVFIVVSLIILALPKLAVRSDQTLTVTETACAMQNFDNPLQRVFRRFIFEKQNGVIYVTPYDLYVVPRDKIKTDCFGK
jgi:hypothetical protein